jgi:hypothetical protein
MLTVLPGFLPLTWHFDAEGIASGRCGAGRSQSYEFIEHIVPV